MKRVLLIGGSSEIGLAIVRRLAAGEPVRPVLLGRDPEALERALAGLEAAGCSDGRVAVIDARDAGAHQSAVADAFAEAGGFEIVVLAVGLLGAQAAFDADPALAREVLETNFVGAGSLLLESLRALRAQGSGTLIVLSSVAAQRPRKANAIYGAAKAGLDALANGLADAVHDDCVRVLIVRPGFVRTKMTAGLPVAPLATTPDAVAEATVKGLERGSGTVWAPAIMRPVFALLELLPRALWRRLPL